MILKYFKYINESVNSSSNNRRISNFKDFSNPNFIFVKSLYANRNLSDQELIEKYKEFVEFRDGADYLRKEAKYIPLFFRLMDIEGKTEQELRGLYNDIKMHRNTIKQNNIDLTLCISYEEVIDKLIEISLIEKTNKFTKLLPSYLRNEIKANTKLLTEFSEIIIEYNYGDYKNNFLRKVNIYKNVKELLGGLRNHLDSFYNNSTIINKVSKHPGAEIVHNTDAYLVTRIYSKAASIALGSQQWCITNRNGSMWDNYISKEVRYDSNRVRPGVQYFIWDYTLDASDSDSLIGVTVYVNGNCVAHDRNDTSIEIDNKMWREHLVPFGELSENNKIRLITENPNIESYTHIISSLSDIQKRKILVDIPKLISYIDDLSFMDKQKLWHIIRKDPEVAKSLQVASALSDEQKMILVVENPDLMEIEFDSVNNPYLSIVDQLDREDKLKMVVNKHSLYATMNLTEEESVYVIEKDPSILIYEFKNIKHVEMSVIRDAYLADKERWDDIISNTIHPSRSEVEIYLSHLAKDDDRRIWEENNRCFILVAEEIKVGEETRLLLYNNYMVYLADLMTPQNIKLFPLMMVANRSPQLNPYRVWVPNDIMPLENINDGEYIFKSNINELVNGSANDKNEQQIYDIMLKDMRKL